MDCNRPGRIGQSVRHITPDNDTGARRKCSARASNGHSGGCTQHIFWEDCLQRNHDERRYEFKETIEADAGAVRQVFANIVLNALEAAPRGTGKLAIRTSASKFVNGKGMAGVRILFARTTGRVSRMRTKRKCLNRCFPPREAKAQGWVLWVTAGLIRRLRGGLRLRSSSQGSSSGTSFSVFLPMNQPPASWRASSLRLFRDSER